MVKSKLNAEPVGGGWLLVLVEQVGVECVDSVDIDHVDCIVIVLVVVVWLAYVVLLVVLVDVRLGQWSQLQSAAVQHGSQNRAVV